MTSQSQDAKAVLDALEKQVNLGQAHPDVLLPKLATLLLSLQGDSPLRVRAHRLLGVEYNRLKLDQDALCELQEARSLAESTNPPSYGEIAKIGRETAVIYARRGYEERAAAEFLLALSFASLEGDDHEVAKIIAEIGRTELKSRRFGSAVMLLRHLVSQGGENKLPPPEFQRVRVHLCQALNRLGAYDEALQHVTALKAEVQENEKRLQFLTRVEEARALSGCGFSGKAEQLLREAETLLPKKDSSRERSEFIQAVTELQEVRGGPPAVKSLQHLIKRYAEQRLVVREVVARRALANTLSALGEIKRAHEALAHGLRSALRENLTDLAEEIRADMLDSASADHLEELTEAIDLIGGGSGLNRRFICIDRLGRGGAGDLSLAIDLTDGCHVTLRKINLSRLSESRRQATMEIVKTAYAAAGQLDDPRVARVLDLRMTPGGVLYSVQRYVAGPTLRVVYASGAAPSQLLELLADVAEALEVLHAKGIFHRDLKLENVIVTRNRQGGDCPVIVDLGIAFVARRPEELKHFDTPPYVAPEQLAGQAVARADIYALGQMIAEVWGGKIPAHSTIGRLWRRGAPDEMPRAIADLVRRMLAPDPARHLSDLKMIAGTLRAQSQPPV